jgi:hypothetical protein
VKRVLTFPYEHVQRGASQMRKMRLSTVLVSVAVMLVVVTLLLPYAMNAEESAPPGAQADALLPAASEPTPIVECTPPPCSSPGALVCGDPNGCPGGCGTICQMPEPVCTPPPCSSPGTLVCGNPDGCPGGCGTICLSGCYLPFVTN